MVDGFVLRHKNTKKPPQWSGFFSYLFVPIGLLRLFELKVSVSVPLKKPEMTREQFPN